jgi:hypothetical protein
MSFSRLPTAELRLISKIGGLSRVLKYGPEATTAAARAGFRAKFTREVDPDGVLDPVERERLAQLAMQRHMAALRLARSRKARAATFVRADVEQPAVAVDRP